MLLEVRSPIITDVHVYIYIYTHIIIVYILYVCVCIYIYIAGRIGGYAGSAEEGLDEIVLLEATRCNTRIGDDLLFVYVCVYIYIYICV